MKTEEKLWDVGIIEIATGKIESIIGTNLNERQMERRIETGIGRINDNYFVCELPVGKYKKGDIRKEPK